MKDILLGMAVGDAFGVPYEFLSREDARRRVTENMQGWGTHNQPPGTWSDDTSLALCTADAIAKGYSVDKVAQNFASWMDEGFWTPHGTVFDIGGSTRDAINRLRAGVDPVLAGGEDEMDNGNGSLMRILPILWYFEHKGHYDIRTVAELSAITHGHPRSMTACVILVRFAQLILYHGIELAYDKFKKEIPLCHQIAPAMKKKAVFMTIYDDEGNIIEKIPMTAADDDWIRAARLRKKAEEGDKEAAEELKKMENTQMYYFDDDE